MHRIRLLASVRLSLFVRSFVCLLEFEHAFDFTAATEKKRHTHNLRWITRCTLDRPTIRAGSSIRLVRLKPQGPGPHRGPDARYN